jgi:NADPH2:quinone reductase
MPRVVRAHCPGPPSVLVVEELPLSPLRETDVRIRHTAIGVNFTDVYHRSGAYPCEMPITLGFEAAGVVSAVGRQVRDFSLGDRVGYVWKRPGAYADERDVPAAHLLKLPSSLRDDVAGTSLLKGLTAEYLLRRAFRVEARHTVVVTAAAGGVGSLLCQWTRALGSRSIGIVSSREKARVALAAGADHVLIMDEPGQLARRVRALAPEGVDVVYDSVGRDTFLASLDMLKPRGLLALYGQSSGAVDSINPALLWSKGSLFVTRPSLFDYIFEPEEYRVAAAALFDLLSRAVLQPSVTRRYGLVDAARAHADLETRRTTGSLVLTP